MYNLASILSQVLPLAKDDEHAAELAAKLGPPPPENFQPHTGSMGKVGQMAMPQHPMVPANGPMTVPPMNQKTQGETRTNIGQHLMGTKGAY